MWASALVAPRWSLDSAKKRTGNSGGGPTDATRAKARCQPTSGDAALKGRSSTCFSTLFFFFLALAAGRRCLSFRTWPRCASVQMVVIQHGVEDQKETARGLAAPYGIVGEQDHMPLAVRHVDHRRLFRNLIGSGNHAAQEQIPLRREAQDHAGEGLFGGQEPARIIRRV